MKTLRCRLSMTTAITVAGAFAALSAGTAFAADLDEIIYSPQVDRTVPVEIGNGWYLRGDIGYSVETDGEGDDYSVGGVPGGFDDSRIDSEFSGSIGVGYQFTDFLRADVTADYSEGDFTGSSASGPCAVLGPCSAEADLDTIGLMANAYVDLGTFVGITPYLGAGIGATHTDWGPVTVTSDATGLSATLTGERDWRLTYALMAGASYDLSKSLKLDLGYRYSNVAGGDFFAGDGVEGDDDGFSKHEIRAGLRYMLW